MINAVNWYLDLTHLLPFPLNQVLCRRSAKRTNRWHTRVAISNIEILNVFNIWGENLMGFLPVRFFISISVFWDVKITFLALLFHFAETETCPLCANRELQSFGLLVSNWGAVTRCQNVCQETTTKADPLYHRLVVKELRLNEYLLKSHVPLMLGDGSVRELCYSCKGLCQHFTQSC